MQQKSCGCVLFKQDPDIKYLFLTHRQGHLDFPKGHQEPGETDEQTCRRELQEETGVTETEQLDFKESMEYYFTHDNQTIHKTVVFFLFKTNQTEIKVSPEHQGFVWLNYEQAMEQLQFENQKDLLKKAHHLLTST